MNKKKVITFRIGDELRGELRERQKRDKKTASYIIVKALEEYFSKN